MRATNSPLDDAPVLSKIDLRWSWTVSDDADLLADLADLRPDAQVEDASYREHLEAFDRFTALLRSTGEWSGPHPWLLTFLPGSAAVRTARGILDDLSADDLGDHGLVLFYPLSTAAIATPLARVPDEPVVYPFNLVRFVSRPDAGRAAAMVRQNHEVYGRVRSAGGTLYPVSALDVPLEEHLGERWADWRRWKERVDPFDVLTPGYQPANSSTTIAAAAAISAGSDSASGSSRLE